LIGRRAFLGAALGTLAWPWSRAFAALPQRLALAPGLEKALETSGFVYISPLRSDGSESTCHGEVWFGWLDGSVTMIASSKTWKAQSLVAGRDGARIWVGDHGTWKRVLGRGEEFRKAPHFDATGQIVMDAAMVDRLLSIYDRKYPDKIGAWRDKMREGCADGTRVLIRYTPAAGSSRT